MISNGTVLTVGDNSGARFVKCIKVCGPSTKRFAKCGDLIIGSVKALKSVRRGASKVSKSEVIKGIILRTNYFFKLRGSIILKFYENSVVLLSAKNKFLGTRIRGAVRLSLFRNSYYSKILLLSDGAIL